MLVTKKGCLPDDIADVLQAAGVQKDAAAGALREAGMASGGAMKPGDASA